MTDIIKAGKRAEYIRQHQEEYEAKQDELYEEYKIEQYEKRNK